MIIILCFITSVIFYLILKQWRIRQQYPPGPTPLPILGNIPHILYYTSKYGSIVEAMRYFKKNYGPIVTLYFGPAPSVHILEYDMTHEAMLKKGTYFTDRWVPIGADEIRNGLGLLLSNGAYWQEQRRFALHTLRNFGLGRNLMEERIMEEVEIVFKELDKQLNRPINMHEHFDILTGSIINRMLFAYRFDETNSAEFYELKRKLDITLEKFSLTLLGLPLWLQKIVPALKRKRDELMRPAWDVRNFIARQVEERLLAIQEGRHHVDEECGGEDFCDAYYLEMNKQARHADTHFTKDSLIINMFDLYVAGQETTSLTLSWAMIYLLRHPEVEEKCRRELQEVTDSGNRSLSLQDKPKTHYFMAVINEIQRLASILNNNLFRKTTDDVKLGDYLIRKDTPIVAQISIIMSEESEFGNKFDFNPDRYFANDNLQQHVVPFGIGKRECLGKSLAVAELYLILGNLILRYKLSTADSLPTAEEVSGVGIMHRPKKFSMKLIKLQN